MQISWGGAWTRQGRNIPPLKTEAHLSGILHHPKPPFTYTFLFTYSPIHSHASQSSSSPSHLFTYSLTCSPFIQLTSHTTYFPLSNPGRPGKAVTRGTGEETGEE